jgi:signal transduction histidine kinase
MAADLEARVRELQEADRARRQLLADVSHELMTPLTAMRGYLETLALPEAVPDAATRERYVGIVTEETLRLESIIGDLLDLARLEDGGGELQRGRVAVESLFSRAAARHAQALADKSLQLETRIAPGADAVDGDARRLEQAVQNLVANAVRHTPPGGRVTLAAEPSTSADGFAPRAVALSVEDTGPGIPPAHLPHVFERFYRVDTARDQGSGGSGLGLSIVRAIVERHGGRVSVTSPPGLGARFMLTLPVSGSGLVTDETTGTVGAVAERLA